MSWHLLVLLALAIGATARPLQNITLPLPAGTSNHGTPGLLCTPTQWTDIAYFYIFNYVAHAATVLTRPGERSDDYMSAVVGSLLFPALGLYRGIEAILGGAPFMKRGDNLRRAAGNGALCMVVRSKDWTPVDGDKVSNAVFRRATRRVQEIVGEDDVGGVDTSDTSNEGAVHVLTYSPPWVNSKVGWPIYVHRQIIHGTYHLPPGYSFAIVPPDTLFTKPSSQNTIVEISATYNFVRALVALVQSLFAVITLYRSRGDQITQFGYAAFGLTVAPYAVMSAMNLIGNICRPDYASLYMVENSIMEEARRRGGVFNGFVAKVLEGSSVCSCDASEADDVEALHFTAHSSGIAADFTMANPCSPPSPLEKHSSQGADSVCSLPKPHSHTVAPLPKKLNYAGTQNDALLLIPCCNPIQRSSKLSLSDPSLPLRHHIQSLSLRKILRPWKPLHWVPCFAPTRMARSAFRWRFTKYFLTALIAVSPIAIIGILSGFQPGTRPAVELGKYRGWIMLWLLWSVFSGIWFVLEAEAKDATLGDAGYSTPFQRVIVYILSASNSVGGFVVVGIMLRSYGVCTRIGG